MKKGKQILAIIGIVLLVALYLTAFVLALVKNPNATRWFNVAIYSTIIIPIFLWLMIWVAKLLKGKGVDKKDN